MEESKCMGFWPDNILQLLHRGGFLHSFNSKEIRSPYWKKTVFTAHLIHDTWHLCMRLRTDGIKAMSCGFSGGKQVIKNANTRNRSLVC